MKELVQKILWRFGYQIVRPNRIPPDMDPEFTPICTACIPYTLTSIVAIFALYKSVEYIVSNRISGSFAECGVWRGGSCMAMALSLLSLKAELRDIYLFDTFQGMTPAGPEDANVKTGTSAARHMERTGGPKMAYAELAEVKANLKKVPYDWGRFHFMVGDVEHTLPASETGPLALLRLDTDWYESTRCEMEHLYPRLVSGGILIVDDYGSWSGSRKAVDEYFESLPVLPLLNRIDSGMRIAIKP